MFGCFSLVARRSKQAGEPNGAGVGGRVGRSGLLVGPLRSNGPLLLGGCKTLMRMKMWFNEDGSVIVPVPLVPLSRGAPASSRGGCGTVSVLLFLPKISPGDTRAVVVCSLPPGLVPQAPSLLSFPQPVLTQPQSTESLLCARHVYSPFMASYIHGPLKASPLYRWGH